MTGPAEIPPDPPTQDPEATAAPTRHPVRALLASPPVVALDQRAVELASAWRGTAAVDRVLYGLSQAANHSALWHGINLVDALTGDRTRRRRAVRRSVVIATEQALVNGPVKMIARRDRPAARTDHPHGLRVPRTSSFPSGHASAATCAASMLSTDLGMAPVWWSLAGAVAWSRVHVGVHHASDVIAGVAVGRLVADAAGKVWPPPV
ncbi:MAG: phosphatase PAP2 family protein [Microthrixaceae bacterium]